jgi:3-methyladenine DNA glycosylase AlkC
MEPDLLEALTQECRRLEIPRATLIKALCKEFILDAETKLAELKLKEFLK